MRSNASPPKRTVVPGTVYRSSIVLAIHRTRSNRFWWPILRPEKGPPRLARETNRLCGPSELSNSRGPVHDLQKSTEFGAIALEIAFTETPNCAIGTGVK